MAFFAVLFALFLLFHLSPLRKMPALSTARKRAAVALGFFFIAAGALHFLRPSTYLEMIPPVFPFPLAWVYVSGALEVGLGAAMLIPRWRRRAGVGLALLLLAILPANVHVAVSSVTIDELPYPSWYFWVRIPFQAVYFAWALWAGGLVQRGTYVTRLPVAGD